MRFLTRRSFLAGLAAAPMARGANAALVPYALTPNGTSVGFSFDLSGVSQSGTMPIQSTDIQIDTRHLQNSQVSVVLNVAAARTKLPFARAPMLSEGVLNAQTHPTITFTSTRIRLGSDGRISDGALITGDLTMRGVTRPMSLKAALYRRPGSDADDLSALSIRLAGALDRHTFGASGYPELVADLVSLDIRAQLVRRA